jgi:hypothetical protein
MKLSISGELPNPFAEKKTPIYEEEDTNCVKTKRKVGNSHVD